MHQKYIQILHSPTAFTSIAFIGLVIDYSVKLLCVPEEQTVLTQLVRRGGAKFYMGHTPPDVMIC